MGKEEEKARQIRMAKIESMALSSHAEGAAKKKSKLSKTNEAVVTSISSEDVSLKFILY